MRDGWITPNWDAIIAYREHPKEFRMGQATDRDGNVLGDAYGDTKREVFAQLNDRYPEAVEIRIRALGLEAASASLYPLYRCHKEVRAVQLGAVGPQDQDGSAFLYPTDGHVPFKVTPAWLMKHQPHVGGYYVIYADGYASFSPKDAFEGGYTRV